MNSRRTFLQGAINAIAGLGGASQLLGMNQPLPVESHPVRPNASDRSTGIAPIPVIAPDVKNLAFTIDNGAKVFQLIAEPVKRKIAPWKTIDCWGFNGSSPGPTIQVNQGDHVRVIFDNHLPEPSSIHWHGFEDAVGFDGMPVISQEPVKPGGRFVYEFDIHQAGTFFYHSHMAMQE